MKNCPLCGHEYYDEAKRCPDCDYSFTAGPPALPPDDESVGTALEKLAAGEDSEDGLARRLDTLYREAGEETNELWRRSVEHLKSVREYEMALRLWERWKKARPRNER